MEGRVIIGQLLCDRCEAISGILQGSMFWLLYGVQYEIESQEVTLRELLLRDPLCQGFGVERGDIEYHIHGKGKHLVQVSFTKGYPKRKFENYWE